MRRAWMEVETALQVPNSTQLCLGPIRASAHENDMGCIALPPATTTFAKILRCCFSIDKQLAKVGSGYVSASKSLFFLSQITHRLLTSYPTTLFLHPSEVCLFPHVFRWITTLQSSRDCSCFQYSLYHTTSNKIIYSLSPQFLFLLTLYHITCLQIMHHTKCFTQESNMDWDQDFFNWANIGWNVVTQNKNFPTLHYRAAKCSTDSSNTGWLDWYLRSTSELHQSSR